MKSGGADVRVLRTPDPWSDTRNDMMRCAAKISQYSALESYLVVGLMKDGTYSCGFHFPEDCRIPPTLMPSYIAEIARRECITQQEAIDVFNRCSE